MNDRPGFGIGIVDRDLILGQAMLEVGERASRLERWVSTTFARLAAGYQRLLVPAAVIRS